MDQRILQMYAELAEGKALNKEELAARFKVSTRTIQRDLEELRVFFAEDTPQNGMERKIIFNKKERCYHLNPPVNTWLNNEEIFTVVKILLENRSLVKNELHPIIEKLVGCCYPKGDRQVVAKLLQDERFNYIEPRHGKELLSKIWSLGQAVNQQLVLEVNYFRHSDETTVRRILNPVGLLCSEYYFYLLAYFDASDEVMQRKGWKKQNYPNTYRVDRIIDFQVTKKHFRVEHMDRFNEGEFRKRVQFMFAGGLQTLKFWCAKQALEAVQDRLPTATIVKEDKTGKGYILTAETYGEGAEMWLRSQGEAIKKIKLKK